MMAGVGYVMWTAINTAEYAECDWTEHPDNGRCVCLGVVSEMAAGLINATTNSTET